MSQNFLTLNVDDAFVLLNLDLTKLKTFWLYTIFLVPKMSNHLLQRSDSLYTLIEFEKFFLDSFDIILVNDIMVERFQ